MNIGYDISQTFCNPAGCGYYAKIFYQELLKENYKVIGYRSFGSDFFDSTFNNKSINNNEFVFKHDNYRDCHSFWDETDFNLTKFSELGSPDLIHSNNFFSPPTYQFCKTIYTLYDLSFFTNPKWTSMENWKVCSNGVFSASLNSSHIVTISNFSKKAFISLFPNYKENNISIIYPTSRFSNYSLSENYQYNDSRLEKNGFFLSVGTLEPRKNHLSILRSYHKFLNLYNGIPPYLVFAGGKGWLFNETMKYINENNLQDKIIFTDYISNDALFWLYKNCLLNIYLSHYEGFGMPILEALTSNAKTVASNIEPFIELFGDSIIRTQGNEEEFLVDLFTKVAQDNSYLNSLDVSKEKIIKKFDLHVNVNNLISLYSKI